MPRKREPAFGTPDEMSPEWTEYETRWSVLVSDFASPVEAAQFLSRRKKIFAAAAKFGIPKEMLTPFGPDKPGFEGRVHDAFENLANVATSVSTLAAE
jgi:hypothetical protein